MKDLDGLLVVSVEQAVAGPYASGKLADAGARVLKIERPEGDFARGYDKHVNGNSSYFVWLNRGKQSICLDLKKPEDHAILNRMLTQADIFIQNLAPGAIERIGFGPAKLRDKNPRLITCSISGYGQEGPRRDQKAYDLLIQAESGLCAINGTEDAPARVGISVCDIAAGMTAHQSILQALYVRERTGQGRQISISLFHALADWMNVPYLQHRYGKATPKRVGLKHPSIAPYGAYACGDGKVVLISIQNEREWQNLCSIVLGRPELSQEQGFANNSDRVANRTIVDGIFDDFFKKQTREENIALLKKADIAYGRLSDLDDLMEHPQNRFIRVETENGGAELLAPAAVVAGRSETYGSVPKLNEHGDKLRNEFGSN